MAADIGVASVCVVETGEGQSFQPFQCRICQSRFTRHENLKRHAALHTRPRDQVSYSCDLCSTTFSRRDLLHRHMKRKHSEQQPGDAAAQDKRSRRHRTTTTSREWTGRRTRPPTKGAAALSASSTSSSAESSSSTQGGGVFAPQQHWASDAAHITIPMDGGAGPWPMEEVVPGEPQGYHHYSQYGHSPASSSESSTNATGAPATPTDDGLAGHDQLVEDHNNNNTDLRHPSTASEGAARAHAAVVCAPHPEDLDLDISLDTSILDFAHLSSAAGPLPPLSSLPPPPPPPALTDATGFNGHCPSSSLQSITHPPEGLSPRDLAFLQIDWCPSPAQVARGLDLYFSHVSHFVPFLHRPTFDAARASRWLVLAILCLAYQHGEDPDADGEVQGSGESLSLRCFHQARVLLASQEEEEEEDSAAGGDKLGPGPSARSIEMVQAYLLLEICAVMYLCGGDSAHGLRIHHKMISVARSSGLTQTTALGVGGASSASALSASTAAREDSLDALWAEFVRAESYKRTILAAHQIDALWYQLLSMPRSLSHLEIKHELPCPLDCWTAASAAEWALRQLTTARRRTIAITSSSSSSSSASSSSSSSCTSMQYADAVRLFLSSSDSDSNEQLASLPAFDPYGAINITHFLLSSAREVSGWSAITGRLSLDRLAPLRASLLALGPFVRPPPPPPPLRPRGVMGEVGVGVGVGATTTTNTTTNTTNNTHTSSSVAGALVQSRATWEIAMIELQIWSQSHTCGRIEGSVDAVLREATAAAASGDVAFGAETAQAAQPHIAWFLLHLDGCSGTTGKRGTRMTRTRRRTTSVSTSTHGYNNYVEGNDCYDGYDCYDHDHDYYYYDRDDDDDDDDDMAESEPPWISLYAYKAFLIAWQLVRERIPCAMEVVGVRDGDVRGAVAWARRVFQRRARRRVARLIVECLDLLPVH